MRGVIPAAVGVLLVGGCGDDTSSNGGSSTDAGTTDAGTTATDSTSSTSSPGTSAGTSGTTEGTSAGSGTTGAGSSGTSGTSTASGGTASSSGGTGTGSTGSTGSGSTGAGTTGGIELPGCSPAYDSYFLANPTVGVATLTHLDETGELQLCTDLEALEANGTVVVDEPAASAGCDEPTSCAYINLTPAERMRILAAKYAHAIWLDHHGTLPWSLADYTADELDGLFDPNVLFRNNYQFYSVVDHSPSEAWAYVVEQSLVAGTPADTLTAVVADLRSTDAEIDFVHGIGGTHPVDTAYTLDQALRDWVDQGTLVRVSRKGCHSMSRISLGLLRVMNIPGWERHDGQWFTTGHSTADWPTLERTLSHGDDMYAANLRAAPAANIPTPYAFYGAAENTAVCGTDKGCLGARHGSLTAVAHPAKYTLDRCCDPGSWGYASCAEYLDETFGATLTAAERTAAEPSILAACP